MGLLFSQRMSLPPACGMHRKPHSIPIESWNKGTSARHFPDHRLEKYISNAFLTKTVCSPGPHRWRTTAMAPPVLQRRVHAVLSTTHNTAVLSCVTPAAVAAAVFVLLIVGSFGPYQLLWRNSSWLNTVKNSSWYLSAPLLLLSNKK